MCTLLLLVVAVSKTIRQRSVVIYVEMIPYKRSVPGRGIIEPFAQWEIEMIFVLSSSVS